MCYFEYHVTTAVADLMKSLSMQAVDRGQWCGNGSKLSAAEASAWVNTTSASLPYLAKAQMDHQEIPYLLWSKHLIIDELTRYKATPTWLQSPLSLSTHSGAGEISLDTRIHLASGHWWRHWELMFLFLSTNSFLCNRSTGFQNSTVFRAIYLSLSKRTTMSREEEKEEEEADPVIKIFLELHHLLIEVLVWTSLQMSQ